MSPQPRRISRRKSGCRCRADTWFDRQKYGVYRLTPEIFAGQQKIADAFFKLGLIPNRIDVSSAAWSA